MNGCLKPFYEAIQTEQYVYVGSFKKPRGENGALIARFVEELPDDVLMTLPALFVEMGDTKVPYRIRKMHILSDKVMVELYLIQSKTEAYALHNASIFIPKSLEATHMRPMGPYGFLTGFLVEDSLLGPLGFIKGGANMGDQYIITVSYKGQELLIPYCHPFVIETNQLQKKIITKLPTGYIQAMF